MRPVREQLVAALAKARGITLEEAARQVDAATKRVSVRRPKGH